MGLSSRRRTRWAWAALAVLLLAALADTVQLQRLRNLNQDIVQLQTGGSLMSQNDPITAPTAQATATSTSTTSSTSTAPELQFAKAFAHAASGADDAALNLYRSLQGDTPLGQNARYNSANALLRQAQRVRDSGQAGPAVPLIELAKETLREVLRNEPGHWPARYNLERAQRLLPEAADEDDGPAQPPPKAERAATTMRGFSPGLP
jgi:mxaK protein